MFFVIQTRFLSVSHMCICVFTCVCAFIAFKDRRGGEHSGYMSIKGTQSPGDTALSSFVSASSSTISQHSARPRASGASHQTHSSIIHLRNTHTYTHIKIDLDSPRDAVSSLLHFCLSASCLQVCMCERMLVCTLT